MTTYKMSLIANFRDAEPITPRSFPLGFCLDAPWDEKNATYEVNANDDLTVTVYVLPPANGDGSDYAVRALNIVSWRAPRAVSTQVFNGMLRNNPDGPDETILAAGHAHFVQAFEATPPAGAQLEHPTCFIAEEPYVAFDMVMPTKLILERPGLFSFLVALTIASPDGLPVSFIIDPELDVGGTYPPD